MIRRLAGCAALVFASCQPAPPPSFSFARQVDSAEAVQFRSFRKDGRLTAQVSMDEVEFVSRQSFRSEVRSFLKDVTGAIAPDEEMRKKLRALGYLDP